MKISRLKKAQKNLAYYSNNYGFREPYQVLIDGTFCAAALENKFNIQEQLPKYLQAEVKMLTTPCIIIETERLGPEVFGAMLIVKKFPLHKCNHEKNPTSGSNCLRAMISKTNLSRYIIATQDRQLQDKIRKIPGAPLIYLHGRTPTLEPPSEASKNKAQELIKKVCLNSFQEETLKKMKEISGLAVEDKILPKKKRKKGGPNPLSCKKKKTKTVPVSVQAAKNTGKVRKRKRVKIAAHIKELLKSS